MAKAIKRVGVIFLAVAIICLMAVGVLLGANGAKKDELSINLKSSSEQQIAEISEEVLLDGATCEEQAIKWNDAITKSLADGGGKHILVTMTKDWIANWSNGNSSFGTTANSFQKGCILIPVQAVITLDLNGCTIDRNLKKQVAYGYSLLVKGTLNLKDTLYNYEEDKLNSVEKIDAIKMGKITGSANNGGDGSFGGGLRVTGVLNMYGGIIYNNIGENGGGIGLADNNTVGAVVSIYGGLIAFNKAVSNGGGIGVGTNGKASNTLVLKGGIISNNISASIGGGIYINSSNDDIQLYSGVQIYDNHKQDSTSNEINYVKNNLVLTKNVIINIKEKLSNKQTKIGLTFFNNTYNVPFTNGYSTFNNDSPYEYFSNDYEGSMIHIYNQELYLSQTIKTTKYDFIYFENGKRMNYKEKDIIHIIDDYKLSQSVNEGKLIIGNINANTSVNDFIANLEYEATRVKLYNAKGVCVFDKGNPSGDITAEMLDNGNALSVGTGWKVETYSVLGNKLEEIYLSVLGDLTGDGKVNTLDITFMRRIATSVAEFDCLKVEFKLAALITNKGSVINADADILWDSMDETLKLSNYF